MLLECSRWLWHCCFFRAGVDEGDFSPTTIVASEVKNKDNPSFTFEMLPSSLMAEDMKEEFEDILKVSSENSSSRDFQFVLTMFCLVKSRVKL